MLNKTTVTKIWCIFFWSIFAIQLFPMVFGGVANVLMYFLTLFLFCYFARKNHCINLNLLFLFGIFVYIMETALILNENEKINIVGVTINYSLYKMCFWMVGILCAVIFIQIASQKELKVFRDYYLIIAITNALANLFVVIFIDPNASRYVGKEGVAQIIGTSDYDMVYSITLLLPCFLYLFFKAKGRRKIKYILLNLIIVLYILKASFFIAVLAMILGITLFAKTRSKNKVFKYMWVVGIVLVVGYFVVNSSVFYEMLLYVANRINNDNFSARITQLVSFMRDGAEIEGAIIRLDIYKRMLEGFIKHPLLGCIIIEPDLYTSYAGHSTILDMLCGYGLLVCVPLFGGFHSMMVKIRRRIECGKDVFNSCYMVFIFIAIFNPVTNGALLMTTIMVVPYVLLCVKEENYEKNSCISS